MRTRKLLVPLDGSPTSEAALPFAEALAHRTQATIALIRAVHTQSMPLIADAEEYLATFAEQLASRALAVETGVPFGSPAEWIVEEIARSHGCDADPARQRCRPGSPHRQAARRPGAAGETPKG
jgi:nucleotide-binding universal stress UspA family protein